MADKASRGLVICADGFVPLISNSHSHLHSLASHASCGFLSLRDSSSAENEERVVRELAQLLDVHDGLFPGEEHADLTACLESNTDQPLTTLSERFMGLRAAILTNCPIVNQFGAKLGFSVLTFDQFIKSTEDVACASSAGFDLLKLLGFSANGVLEKSEFDLVFLHINSGKHLEGQLDWLNALIGQIMDIAQAGSEVASRLHLSLLMSYGSVSKKENGCSVHFDRQKEMDSNLWLLFPCQSYSMKGGSLLNNVRHHHPLLVAQWQDAVTRKDMAETFSFEDFKERGGNGTIPADRFLHEVAFKLWKAPKYGA